MTSIVITSSLYVDCREGIHLWTYKMVFGYRIRRCAVCWYSMPGDY